MVLLSEKGVKVSTGYVSHFILCARRSSSSHANSTVSDVGVTCLPLPSVRPSYFPPLSLLAVTQSHSK